MRHPDALLILPLICLLVLTEFKPHVCSTCHEKIQQPLRELGGPSCLQPQLPRLVGTPPLPPPPVLFPHGDLLVDALAIDGCQG